MPEITILPRSATHYEEAVGGFFTSGRPKEKAKEMSIQDHLSALS